MEEAKWTLLSEGSYSKKDTHYIISTIWHSENGNIIENKKIYDCERFRVSNTEYIDEAQGMFRTVSSILYYTVKMGACHYRLVKTQICLTKIVNYKVNYGI